MEISVHLVCIRIVNWFNLVVTRFVTIFCFVVVAVGGMNRPQKCAPQIKKVAPPSVPDNSTYRHSGSSFGSAGYSSSGEDSCFSDTITKGTVIFAVYFLIPNEKG